MNTLISWLRSQLSIAIRCSARSRERYTLLSASRCSTRSAAILALIGAAACSGQPTAVPFQTSSPAANHLLARDAADEINRFRIGQGCSQFQWDAASASVGSQYAKRMSDEAFFGHIGPDGSTLKARLHAARIGYQRAAETIAAGAPTATTVVTGWLLSPPHREILSSCEYTDVGIGFYEGNGPYGTYWTAVFLTR